MLTFTKSLFLKWENLRVLEDFSKDGFSADKVNVITSIKFVRGRIQLFFLTDKRYAYEVFDKENAAYSSNWFFLKLQK